MRLVGSRSTKVELTALSRSLGIPADFDIAQFCWKPDYDPYFYQELKKRSQNVYFFRDEFVFQLHERSSQRSRNWGTQRTSLRCPRISVRSFGGIHR